MSSGMGTRKFASNAAEERVRERLLVIPPEGKSHGSSRVLDGSVLGMMFLFFLFILSQIEMPTVPFGARWVSEQIASTAVFETEVERSQPIAAEVAEMPAPPPIVELVVPQATEVPSLASASKAYTVKLGDTLSGIAGKNWPTVCEQNNLGNCNLIYPGQVIELPPPLTPHGKGEAP